jgi:hypothetical protein
MDTVPTWADLALLFGALDVEGRCIPSIDFAWLGQNVMCPESIHSPHIEEGVGKPNLWPELLWSASFAAK